jgi:predicted outer membrane repeat protein
LTGNTITGDDAAIVSTGVITSNITININDINDNMDETVNITASVTDDKGNLIALDGANKLIFDVEGVEIAAAYNATSKLYYAEYTLPGPGVYTVNATYVGDNCTVKKGTIWNYRGTFTDLASKISLVVGDLYLPYDFKYIPEIDGSSYLEGIDIYPNPVFTINGNGHIIDGANSVRIFRIWGDTVILNNITFVNGNASFGGALTIDTYHTYINDCTFENNTALKFGGAIYISSDMDVAITNSTFKGNKADGNPDAIYSEGYLTLVNNAINTEYAEITVTQHIPTQCYATVFDGISPVYVDDAHVILTARVHDDNYNLIYATQDVFQFNITDSNGGSQTVYATAGYETYTASYDLPAKGYYDVTLQYHNYIQANTATVAYVYGTYTDLQRLVDAAEGELNLTHDFAYDPVIDGTNFTEGVLITKL